MTRVSTHFAFERGLSSMSQQRQALVDLQEQMTTGRKVNTPADDPINAAQAERTRAQLARIELETRMMGFAKTQLGQAENAMGGATESLQFARETLVAAGNGAYGPGERAQLAQRLRNTRDELLSIANMRDGAGAYVFAGQGSTTAPFSADGSPSFLATAGEQTVGLDVSYATSHDGRAIFMDLSAGDARQSIFQTLDETITLLEDASADNATLRADLDKATSGVDSAIDTLLQHRTRAGEKLSSLESRERLLESGKLEAKTQLSSLQDLDYLKAISDFQNGQMGLNAAMQSYSSISKLTLFNYL